MSTPAFRSWVEVSRRQIAENYQAVRAAAGPGVEILAVVKADAYGHGAVEVARTLAGQGARWLAVSSVEEGATLRDAGIPLRILVMADNLPGTRQALIEHDLTPVVHTLEDLRALDEAARTADRELRYHLKIDTGMGRLGTQAAVAEIAAAVEAAGHMRLEGLMTHLASAADYTTRSTDRQVRAFQELCGNLCRGPIAPEYFHMAATIPIAYGRREAFGNMVRPGHALYGYVSPARGEAPPSQLQVQPALTWKASVLAVKEVPEGTAIGYGGMFRAPRAMRIAVLAVGYADGVSHRLSNRGQVIAAGKLAPILGAVSMDLTTIDVTECPSIVPGDAVTLLGREGDVTLNAQQIARAAGTISYDILCRISARVKRVWV
jgi:alanine racemase